MIQFLDLRTQYQQIGPAMEEAVLAAMRSGTYVLGAPVERFEEGFARYCGAKHAIAVSSGTSALHMALLAAGIGPGDEVITTPTTFVATVAAILYAGATPVLVDIDPATWNIDPRQVAAAITPRTRAIMPVHLHGRLADMSALCDIAEAHGLILIEDAAQAHGARRGKIAGTFGAMGCFSFYPGKNLGACGEGGAVITDDDALAARLRCLRDWGQEGRYNHVMLGYNYRMDAVQGAVLGVKLPHLDRWTEARRAVANAYEAGLSPDIARAAGPFGADHVCHVYAIRSPVRDALRAKLEGAGVPTNIHYPRPVHLQPGYASLGYQRGAFPIAEAYADTTLSLPIHPHMSPEQVATVIDTVNLFAAVPIAATA
ncbi:DegT/DnrJ/EryC1/StrS family aminotransferase [Falsirhodobacter algicola]|uniref:Aminotransferase class I/II-fold pyridoxal phosphate-dependent enzyme n=1 Tax=Falsirhodobacter algicola TaxID=2692330 RepID=A0A8J8MR03_9RHOB|nr:DegT/DnrJ/EryC1/StrS family aminotransferase [Falsirhodobacter algicola]QUS35105.1 aminotransferase class I/II-fold pyridoxal phosphate-dependent enzyme [Falsirhodobacter algicola]